MIKQTMMKLLLLSLVISLTACSTNTRDQNTAIGVGSGAVVGGLVGSIGGGWAIAAGAVVGALVGGVVGHSMDSTDYTNASMAMNSNSMDEPANWTNERTGVWYKVVPTSKFITYKGNPYCRHYIAYTKHHGKVTETKGIACRVEGNMWKQVR